MFVRFRPTTSRLQVSLIETRRADGRVRHEHIASLGSAPITPTTADRIAFWSALHERLAKLGNRLVGEAQGKVLGAVHARIPMVTADEQRALQLENAESDERFWTRMHGLNHATAEDNKGLATVAANKIANAQTAAANAATKAAIAKDRAERIKRGENVEGGLGKPMDYEEFVRILHAAGFSNADIAHVQRVAELAGVLGEDNWEDILQLIVKGSNDAADRYRRNAVRRVMRALQQDEPLDNEQL
jgi:hypothetical protein